MENTSIFYPIFKLETTKYLLSVSTKFEDIQSMLYGILSNHNEHFVIKHI